MLFDFIEFNNHHRVYFYDKKAGSVSGTPGKGLIIQNAVRVKLNF